MVNILEDKKELFFQINITQFCPLNCTHCYILEEERKIKQFLKREDYLLFFNHIKKIIPYYKKKYNFVKDIFLQILGGEPLSNNVEYYEILLNDIKRLKSEIKNEFNFELNLEVSTSLASSKFLKNEWINLFKKFNNENILISTSFEKDTNRFNVKTFEKWIHNVKTLKSKNIKIDLNYILTKENTKALYIKEKKILDLFENFESIYMYYFISYGSGLINEDKLLPEYEETIEVLKNIKNNEYNFNINGLFKENNNLTWEEDELFNINLTPEGKIEYNLGVFDINFHSNVYDDTESIIRNLNKYITWNINTKQKYIIKTCNDCEFLKECKGGFEEYSNINFLNFNDCKGYKKFRLKNY